MEYGCSRMVILTEQYAIKLPNLKYRWPAALWGIIHNLAERSWWQAAEGRVCEPKKIWLRWLPTGNIGTGQRAGSMIRWFKRAGMTSLLDGGG